MGDAADLTMRLTRRRMLTATAALAAGLPIGTRAGAEEFDCIVVGAGAAGIAAARKILAHKRSVLVIEAADHIGGRCVTDTKLFGVPFDRGAHWLHMPDINPVAKLARTAGLDIYEASGRQRLRISGRDARDNEIEDHFVARNKATRAIMQAGSGKKDVPAASALPKDLGDWRATIAFELGPYSCACDLDRVSAIDFASSEERDIDAFCRQGFGAALARLAKDLPVRLLTPVSRVSTGGQRVELTTPKGTISARTAIITASLGVLAAGRIRFDPPLPKSTQAALETLKLGSYDHIAIEMPGNPLGLGKDETIIAKAGSARTAAMLANIGGTDLSLLDVGGSFGAELAKGGEAVMTAYAREWIADQFGVQAREAISRAHATNWNADPLTLGAFSCAPPGGAAVRKDLETAVRGKLFFAGEAVHQKLWGTVGGAWESGERAAVDALRRLGVRA